MVPDFEHRSTLRKKEYVTYSFVPQILPRPIRQSVAPSQSMKNTNIRSPAEYRVMGELERAIASSKEYKFCSNFLGEKGSHPVAEILQSDL